MTKINIGDLVKFYGTDNHDLLGIVLSLTDINVSVQTLRGQTFVRPLNEITKTKDNYFNSAALQIAVRYLISN